MVAPLLGSIDTLGPKAGGLFLNFFVNRFCVAFAVAVSGMLLPLGCAPAENRYIILCFGDSITAQGSRWGGYVTLADKLLGQVCPGLRTQVVAAGVPGSRVPDLERRLQAEVLTHAPDVVVVYIGINDVWHMERGGGTPKPEYESGLRRLVERMRATGIQVILCTPSVIGEKSMGMNRHDAMLAEYADTTRQVATETGAALVDLQRTFQRYLKAHNPRAANEGILTYDGIHLNRAGNSLVAQAIVDRLVLMIPCEPPRLTPAP